MTQFRRLQTTIQWHNFAACKLQFNQTYAAQNEQTNLKFVSECRKIVPSKTDIRQKISSDELTSERVKKSVFQNQSAN